MGAICCHEWLTRVPIRSGPKPNAATMMLQIKFGSISQLVAEIFMFESVNTRKPAQVPSYKLTFGSGELNQRTNGPVNAHLISWPSKAQNKQNLENIW